jgi:hypothetical protein
VGFFGVLLLALLPAHLGQKTVKPPGWPALLHRADGSTEEIRWIEFKANDPDSSKWQYVIERKQPDGTWARATISYNDLARNGVTMEFRNVTGGARKKP